MRDRVLLEGVSKKRVSPRFRGPTLQNPTSGPPAHCPKLHGVAPVAQPAFHTELDDISNGSACESVAHHSP